MTLTLAALIPILRFFASSGAGILASLLFASLRRRLPADQAARLPGGVVWSHLLYAPFFARFAVLALAGLIALPFGAALALAEGHPVLPAVDMLLAAMISQCWHALVDLSGALPGATPAQATASQARLAALNEQEPRV